MTTQIIGPVIFDAGETNIPTAGSRVALSSDGGLSAEFRVIWARFKARPGNTGDVYVGVGDVAITQGWTLEKADSVGLELPISPGASIPLGDINFDAATNNDDVQWAILYQAI